MWIKELVSRKCYWTGINGQDFNTCRYVEGIFYTKEDVDKGNISLNAAANGAVVGGTVSRKGALSHINSCLETGETKVTTEELNDAIKQFQKEIQENKIQKIEHFEELV